MPTTDWWRANYTVSMTVLCQKSLLTISDAFWSQLLLHEVSWQLVPSARCSNAKSSHIWSFVAIVERHSHCYLPIKGISDTMCEVISALRASLLAMAENSWNHCHWMVCKVLRCKNTTCAKIKLSEEWPNLTALKCEGFTVNTQTATAHRPGLHHSTQRPQQWKQPATLAIINTKPSTRLLTAVKRRQQLTKALPQQSAKTTAQLPSASQCSTHTHTPCHFTIKEKFTSWSNSVATSTVVIHKQRQTTYFTLRIWQNAELSTTHTIVLSNLYIK